MKSRGNKLGDCRINRIDRFDRIIAALTELEVLMVAAEGSKTCHGPQKVSDLLHCLVAYAEDSAAA